MGFIKRFLSLKRFRSFKYRAKHSQSTQGLDTGRPAESEQDREAAAAKLLRSSSTHFSVVSEVDYSSLPPIPHPINTVVKSPATSPTRSFSVQTKSTYTVTIHGRTLHSNTEFPNAYPSLLEVPSAFNESPQRSKSLDSKKVPITPRDRNRLSRLRQDPSVASLVSMYDDHGQLDEHAFSNTPKRPTRLQGEGRSQNTRRQSTLRDLLGPSDGEDGLGDISWADGHLAECDRSATSISTTSSLGLETPTDGLFNTDALITVAPSPKQSDHFANMSSAESDMTAQYPAISSMEVELSTATEENITMDEEVVPNQSIVRTPSKRASQVFGFLSDRRKRVASEPHEESRKPFLLPPEDQLPSLNTQAAASPVKFEEDSFIKFMDSGLSLPPPPMFSQDASIFSIPTPPSPAVFHPLPPPPRPKARSTSALEVLKGEQTISMEKKETRLIRGPRPLPSLLPKGTDNFIPDNTSKEIGGPSKMELPRSAIQDPPDSRYNSISEADQYMKIPQRTQRRVDGLVGHDKAPLKASFGKGRKSARQETGPMLMNFNKENDDRYASISKKKVNGHPDVLKISSKYNDVPSTPTKTSPLGPLQINAYQAPSPASSAELSPEAKQLMTNIRERKMRARERERRGIIASGDMILRA